MAYSKYFVDSDKLYQLTDYNNTVKCGEVPEFWIIE